MLSDAFTWNGTVSCVNPKEHAQIMMFLHKTKMKRNANDIHCYKKLKNYLIHNCIHWLLEKICSGVLFTQQELQ